MNSQRPNFKQCDHKGVKIMNFIIHWTKNNACVYTNKTDKGENKFLCENVMSTIKVEGIAQPAWLSDWMST